MSMLKSIFLHTNNLEILQYHNFLGASLLLQFTGYVRGPLMMIRKTIVSAEELCNILLHLPTSELIKLLKL